jgi:hypothetical protein
MLCMENCAQIRMERGIGGASGSQPNSTYHTLSGIGGRQGRQVGWLLVGLGATVVLRCDGNWGPRKEQAKRACQHINHHQRRTCIAILRHKSVPSFPMHVHTSSFFPRWDHIAMLFILPEAFPLQGIHARCASHVKASMFGIQISQSLSAILTNSRLTGCTPETCMQ